MLPAYVWWRSFDDDAKQQRVGSELHGSTFSGAYFVEQSRPIAAVVAAGRSHIPSTCAQPVPRSPTCDIYAKPDVDTYNASGYPKRKQAVREKHSNSLRPV